MSNQAQTTGDFSSPALRALLSKILIDPTWNLSETPRSIRLLRDTENNVLMFPAVLGSTRGSTVAGQTTIVTADIGTIPQGQGGAASISPSVLGNNGLAANSVLNLWNSSTAAYDLKETATTSGFNYATNTSAAMIAAGGASKKYKMFSLSLTFETGAVGDIVSVGDNAGVNNIWSFTAIGAAVTKQSVIISFGENGILQPTANSAISVKASTATAGITGIITVGAAR